MHLNGQPQIMNAMRYFRIPSLSMCLAALFMTTSAWAASAPDEIRVAENAYLRLEMIARTPEQMAAFYEARGFPKAAIHELDRFCFITTSVTNKTREVIWMRLANWIFTDKEGQVLKRVHRKDLLARLQKIGLAQQYRSTFRWTLIPEVLDYRPEEREGGNIALPRTTKPFHLKAEFVMGAKEEGKHIFVELDDLRCVED